MFDLQGLNIYLIGMMGAGKSTIGKLLAERLEYRFLDTDTTIEQLTHQSITEIFQTAGEIEFRQLETQVLTEVSAYTRVVVATGGGIAIKLENWNYLQQGLVVWLDASIDTLVERIKEDRSRPILNTPRDLHSKLEEILTARRNRYAAADLHIPIDSPQTSIDEIVEQIIKLIPTVLRAQVQ
jgi:shikimate kinase